MTHVPPVGNADKPEQDPLRKLFPSAPACLLAGDIGATKTSLALYGPEDSLLAPRTSTTVDNDEAGSLEELIARFLADAGRKPLYACFGVAGPVRDNRVKMTNLDWSLDGPNLAQRFKMQSVSLINDLVATAMGAVHLPEDRLHILNTGTPDPSGAVAVIAPGTGLGEAFLVRRHGRLIPFPTEGGHSSFAPVDERQIRLLRFMTGQHEHVSAELVCSGIAVPSLYDFILAEEGESQPASRQESGDDPTKAIIQAALAEQQGKQTGDPLAAATVKLFVEILASEAANLVLKVLATGGLYIGGGLPPRILPFFSREAFLSRFCRGVYREMLVTIPIRIILEPKAALVGAAAYGLTEHSQAP